MSFSTLDLFNRVQLKQEQMKAGELESIDPRTTVMALLSRESIDECIKWFLDAARAVCRVLLMKGSFLLLHLILAIDRVIPYAVTRTYRSEE